MTNINRGIGARASLRSDVKGEFYFFGIGIKEYMDSAFPSLNNAVKDVEDVFGILKERYGFKKENAFMLFDENATRDKIIQKLDDLQKRLNADDRLIIYFSGHGELESESEKGFWIIHDSSKNGSYRKIRNSTIRDYLEDINCRHILLVVDSCFSGSLFRSRYGKPQGSLSDLDRRQSRWVLTSGKYDQIVVDGEPGKNSPFAESILQVLRQNVERRLKVQKFVSDVQTLAGNRAKGQTTEGQPILVKSHKNGQFIFHLSLDEKEIWKLCVLEDTIAAYSSYLHDFSAGTYRGEAEKRIDDKNEEIDWKDTSKQNTLTAFKSFKLNHPHSKYLDQAQQRIEHLEWIRVQKSPSRKKLHKYVQDNPDGRYMQDAQLLLEKIKLEEEERSREEVSNRKKSKVFDAWAKEQKIENENFTNELIQDNDEASKRQKSCWGLILWLIAISISVAGLSYVVSVVKTNKKIEQRKESIDQKNRNLGQSLNSLQKQVSQVEKLEGMAFKSIRKDSLKWYKAYYVEIEKRYLKLQELTVADTLPSPAQNRILDFIDAKLSEIDSYIVEVGNKISSDRNSAYDKYQSKLEYEKARKVFREVQESQILQWEGLNMKFSDLRIDTAWVYNRIDNSHFQSTEDIRGAKYVTATALIKSVTTNPMLPPVRIYKLEGNKLRYMNTLHCELFSWTSKEHYRGRYNDKKNSFRYSSNVKFSLGTRLVDDTVATGTIFLLVEKYGCFSENYVRWRNEIYYAKSRNIKDYSDEQCMTDEKRLISTEELLRNYHVLKVFNRKEI